MLNSKENLEDRLEIVGNNSIKLTKKETRIVVEEFEKIRRLNIFSENTEYRKFYIDFKGSFQNRYYSIYEYGEGRLLGIYEYSIKKIKELTSS